MRILPLLFATTIACGEKSAPTSAVDAAASTKFTMELPADAASRSFAETLVASTTKDFTPTDGDGAKFEYTSLQFRPDGTWFAEGYVEAMDERMECTESGTWSMTAADSKSVATVTWIVGETNCVGRDNAAESRAQLTVSKAGIDSAMFR